MIVFKKSKEAVLDDIRNAASAAVYNELTYNFNLSFNKNDMVFSLQIAMAKAVEEGFRSMLDNQYTDDDFENDITLR